MQSFRVSRARVAGGFRIARAALRHTGVGPRARVACALERGEDGRVVPPEKRRDRRSLPVPPEGPEVKKLGPSVSERGTSDRNRMAGLVAGLAQAVARHVGAGIAVRAAHHESVRAEVERRMRPLPAGAKPTPPTPLGSESPLHTDIRPIVYI